MKKIFALVAVFMAFAFVLCGCSTKEETPSTEPTTSVEETVEVAATEEAAH